MVVFRHLSICRPPKTLHWKGRGRDIALNPLPLGLIYLLTIHWPFLIVHRQSRGWKVLPLNPCLWQCGNVETVPKLRKHASIKSKNLGYTKVHRKSLGELAISLHKKVFMTVLGAASTAFMPGVTVLGRATMWYSLSEMPEDDIQRALFLLEPDFLMSEWKILFNKTKKQTNQNWHFLMTGTCTILLYFSLSCNRGNLITTTYLG